MMERVGRQCPEFSRRLAALLIDLIILEVALAIIVFVPGATLHFFGRSDVPVMPMISALSYLVFLLCFTLMESSYKHATIGRLFLWMAVANVEGGRMSFNKALLRNIGKYTPPLIVLEISTLAASWTL